MRGASSIFALLVGLTVLAGAALLVSCSGGSRAALPSVQPYQALPITTATSAPMTVAPAANGVSKPMTFALPPVGNINATLSVPPIAGLSSATSVTATVTTVPPANVSDDTVHALAPVLYVTLNLPANAVSLGAPRIATNIPQGRFAQFVMLSAAEAGVRSQSLRRSASTRSTQGIIPDYAEIWDPGCICENPAATPTPAPAVTPTPQPVIDGYTCASVTYQTGLIASSQFPICHTGPITVGLAQTQLIIDSPAVSPAFSQAVISQDIPSYLGPVQTLNTDEYPTIYIPYSGTVIVAGNVHVRLHIPTSSYQVYASGGARVDVHQQVYSGEVGADAQCPMLPPGDLISVSQATQTSSTATDTQYQFTLQALPGAPIMSAANAQALAAITSFPKADVTTYAPFAGVSRTGCFIQIIAGDTIWYYAGVFTDPNANLTLSVAPTSANLAFAAQTASISVHDPGFTGSIAASPSGNCKATPAAAPVDETGSATFSVSLADVRQAAGCTLTFSDDYGLTGEAIVSNIGTNLPSVVMTLNPAAFALTAQASQQSISVLENISITGHTFTASTNAGCTIVPASLTAGSNSASFTLGATTQGTTCTATISDTTDGARAQVTGTWTGPITSASPLPTPTAPPTVGPLTANGFPVSTNVNEPAGSTSTTIALYAANFTGTIVGTPQSAACTLTPASASVANAPTLFTVGGVGSPCTFIFSNASPPETTSPCVNFSKTCVAVSVYPPASPTPTPSPSAAPTATDLPISIGGQSRARH